MVLALTAVMALPMAASAVGNTTTVTGSVAGATVSSLVPNLGMQGGTFSVEIGGTAFTSVTGVNFGSGITVNSYSVDASAQITANITIATGAALGARDVTVTTSAGPGTLAGGFTVLAAPYITVTAPAGFSLGAMTRGAYTTSPVKQGTVATNATLWQITVSDSSVTHTGYMWNGSAAPTQPLFIGKNGTDFTAAWAGPLTYTQADGSPFNFYAQQYIDGDDPAGNYTITLTFTGTVQ